MAKPNPILSRRNVEMVGPRTGRYNSISDLKDVYVPHTIYFYYFRVKAGKYEKPVFFVREELAAITQESLKKIHIPELTRNARKAKPDKPPSKGTGFGEAWTRRSYLVVALDDDDPDNGFDEHDAVDIVRKDDGRRYRNHCFFDGGEAKLEMLATERPIWAAWTVNYMKNRSGKDVPAGKSHTFGFKFKPKKKPPVADDSEDHGTNMGPPIGPP
jgi:hypothetical protein